MNRVKDVSIREKNNIIKMDYSNSISVGNSSRFARTEAS
jgi:hypothetical protein